MGFALAGGLASAAMFAYISGSSFVFIEFNGVSPEQFGFFFGVNAFGLILASQLNRWLLATLHEHAVALAALHVTAGAALLLFGVTLAGVGGFPLMLALLFVTIASTGMVGPNATALAMAPYGRARQRLGPARRDAVSWPARWPARWWGFGPTAPRCRWSA
jgi:DHA1 family bicyclomycin/chloramphenicol resistance-like MFS transporter